MPTLRFSFARARAGTRQDNGIHDMMAKGAQEQIALLDTLKMDEFELPAN